METERLVRVRLEQGPAGIMVRDRRHDGRIDAREAGASEVSGNLSRQRGMVRLRDQPPRARLRPLLLFHGAPRRDELSRGLRIGIEDGSQDHQRAERRMRPAAAGAGPVLWGGLRMPSSNSFNTTALLRSAFFDAKTSVTLLRDATRS